ncbi:MAG TPA: hypothetical protein VI796_00790, partial [Candidatus Thermoplasmatota archaeon]|nr:hypothetical protein [Candidatus Thermoplasmatota archaeon]
AQPGTDITFFGHIFGHGAGLPMPMNTQFPEGESDYSIGQADGCGTPPPAPDGTLEQVPQDPILGAGGQDSCETWDANTQFWYTTAGFVQVKSYEEFTESGGYTLFHNERGMTKDVYFDTSKNPVYTYYMSADFHGWLVTLCDAVCWNWDPGMFQDWVVEAWVWHASLGEWSADPSVPPDLTPVVNRDPAAVLMAHGKTEPFDMTSLDPTLPGGQQTVWPFTAEMAWDPAFAASGGVVPYVDNLIVQFRWYQETDGQKYILGVLTAAPNWNVNSGEDYPANVVLPVRNPMDVELVYPRFVHDKLVVLSVINTPWGSYDIDRDITRLIVKDEAGNAVPVEPQYLVSSSLDNSVAHGGHYKPINATWVWDYRGQGLEPGDYTVTVETTNFQHSYTTSTTGTFSINSQGLGAGAAAGRSGLESFTAEELEQFQQAAGGDATAGPTTEGGGKGSPGVGVVLASLGAVGAAWAARRRRDA